MALTYTQFNTMSLSCVVFTPGGQLVVGRVLLKLLTQFEQFVAGEPQIFPEFDDIRVPRLILNSPDGFHRAEINSQRCVYAVSVPDLNDHLDVQTSINDACTFLTAYLQDAPAEAGRLAFICTRFASQKQAGSALAAHFCQERWQRGPVADPDAFEMHIHHKQMLSNGSALNNWIRFKTAQWENPGTTDTPPSTYPGIVVEQDINTLAEIAESVTYNPAQMRAFYYDAAHRTEELLSIYFSGE